MGAEVSGAGLARAPPTSPSWLWLSEQNICYPLIVFLKSDLKICFYANLNYLYIITIFDLQNSLNQVYNATLDNNIINSDYLFSKMAPRFCYMLTISLTFQY